MTKNEPKFFRPNRAQAIALDSFVENASGNLTAVGWMTNWYNMHGEGRAKVSKSSGITFHIKIRRGSTDHRHYSAIFIKKRQGDQQEAVENTFHDWGTDEPPLLNVLNYYKVKYGKPIVEDPSENGQGDPGEGPAQADGAQDWVKDVRMSYYDGYYYIDQAGNNIDCDEQGNPLPGGDEDEKKDNTEDKDEDKDERTAARDETQGQT